MKTKKDIQAICQLSPEEFEEIKDVITDPVVQKRAKHAVYEENRCVTAVKELNAGNIPAFGKHPCGASGYQFQPVFFIVVELQI